MKNRYDARHPNVIDLLGLDSTFFPHAGLVLEYCARGNLTAVRDSCKSQLDSCLKRDDSSIASKPVPISTQQIGHHLLWPTHIAWLVVYPSHRMLNPTRTSDIDLRYPRSSTVSTQLPSSNYTRRPYTSKHHLSYNRAPLV